MNPIKHSRTATVSCLVSLLVLGAPAIADAASTLYRLEWSGASLSNTATAVGMMSIDLAVWPTNLMFNGTLADAGITDITLTITGATTGNGVFQMADFNTIIFDSRGVTLDMTRELVGQATGGDPFGTPGMGDGGDFNLFGAGTGDPTGTSPFTLAADGFDGMGENMVLTSFAPAVVPEPASFVLVGCGSLALLTRRRR